MFFQKILEYALRKGKIPRNLDPGIYVLLSSMFWSIIWISKVCNQLKAHEEGKVGIIGKDAARE